ncbi:MAG: HlyD family efflux transporter periplasmic adaptor subunit [Bacteroidales bacterium]|nr:HlyD family efflux transporter periplasmic adaptor subunit [Bacteroidales bacterium]
MKKVTETIGLMALVTILTCCDNGNRESFAFGNFEAEEILVPAEANGVLKEMLVSEGDQLREGDKIARIDTVQLHLKKMQVIAGRSAAQAKLTQIRSQVTVQEISLSNLEREHKRFSALFQEDAATAKQLDDIRGQMDVARAQIEALKSQSLAVYADRDAQDAQILQLEDQIRRSLIRSPSDGQLLEIFVRKGEMAMAGRPVIKMAELSNLTLRVFIDGNQLSSIKTGDIVIVLYDGKDNMLQTEGVISWVSPEAEFTPKIIQTREERVNLVYAVKVQVPNNGSLKIGMPGEIQLKNQ